MDNEINNIIDAISTFVEYLNNFTEESRERNTAISKMEEAVFWLTYLLED